MFAIVTCPNCRNDRMVDLSAGTTACPYCGKRFENSRLAVKFKGQDQTIVREVLQGNKDVPIPEDGEEPDPLALLKYRIAHTTDIGQRMTLIAEGLDGIKGEFGLEDIEDLVPGKGERYAAAMLEYCMIHEVGYGRYRV